MSDKSIPASIEISPKQACEFEALAGLFPEQTRVYITDMGESTERLVSGAKRVNDLGYIAVPHFAARRIHSADRLEDRVRRMATEAGVKDVLIVGGGVATPVGELDSSLSMLNTGVFERHGILYMGVAGHPEGSPDFAADVAMEALHQKQAFADKTGIDMRIVTQFGFYPSAFIDWAREVRASGINMPIHLGVVGPTKLTSLIKFATMCGVGNSLSFLKTRGSAMSHLITGFNPEEIVAPIDEYWQNTGPECLITHIHVFPFGGVKKSSAWLRERRSWPALSQAVYAA